MEHGDDLYLWMASPPPGREPFVIGPATVNKVESCPRVFGIGVARSLVFWVLIVCTFRFSVRGVAEGPSG